MTDNKQKVPAELQPKVAALSRSIFMRDHAAAGELYGEILTTKPDYLLRPPVQYDLARLLEVGGADALALQAYQTIIDRQPENSAYTPALKAAGHLAHKLEKFDECQEYLNAFLESNPATPDRQDAEEVLSRLPPTTRRKASSELPTEPDNHPSDIPSSGSWMTTDSGRPVTFEWSVKKKKRDRGEPSSTGDIKLGSGQWVAPGDTPNPSSSKKTYEFESSSPDESLKPFRGTPSNPENRLEKTPPLRPAKREISSGAVYDPRRQSRQSQDESSLPLDISAPAGDTGLTEDQGFEFVSGGPTSVPPPPKKSKQDKDQAKRISDSGRRAAQVDGERTPIPKNSRKKVRVFGTKRGPADHADSDSGLAGISSDEETAEQRYYRLRDGQFALLLPVGKRIHLDAVAQLASAREGIGESQAKKLVLKRKGILYDKLTMNDVLDLHALVSKCRQALIFVNVPRNLRPYEHYDVLSAEPKEPGLKMTTDSAVRRIRWKDIKLINSGNIAGEIVVSVVGADPTKEYRFFESEFDYQTFSPGHLKSFREGLVEFLGVIASNASKAVRSHTVENLLKAKVREPQIFAIHEEYDYYTNWMLFSHFGETVDSAELAEQSKVTSNW